MTKEKKGLSKGKKITIAVVAAVAAVAIGVSVLFSFNFFKKPVEVATKSIDTSTESITVKVGETDYFGYSAMFNDEGKDSVMITVKMSDDAADGKDTSYATFSVDSFLSEDGYAKECFFNNVKGAKAEYALSTTDENDNSIKELVEKFGTKLDATKLDALYTSFVEPAKENESAVLNSDSGSDCYDTRMFAVTGVKAGTDTITITSGDITKTIEVNVVA